MNNIALSDAMFLLAESGGRPAQVVTLQLYKPPADADPQAWVTDYFHQLLAADELKEVFRRRPARSALSPSSLRWIDDEPVELDHHVRHSALPGHGRVRELLEAVSVQHGMPLDRRRPLWEFHVFERLEGDRFATAFKTHHAIADGMSLAKHVLGSLTPDPEERGCRPPWAASPQPLPERPRTRRPNRSLLAPLLSTGRVARSLVDLGRDAAGHVPFEAPPSPLNVKVGGARRFAGDQWPIERLKKIASAAGCTVNDVGLAMAGGALRAYLDELGKLPDRSLIAMVPISVRRPDTDFAEGEGNAFGALLCDLATTTGDPAARLEAIHTQTRAAKERYAAMSVADVLAVSKLIMGGAIVSSFTGIAALPRHPFNLIISNVPATNHPLYYNGARMTDIYPVSMISEAQAMNITLSRYDDVMTFGIVGDRRALPHLQRMLIHLDESLTALDKAVLG